MKKKTFGKVEMLLIIKVGKYLNNILTRYSVTIAILLLREEKMKNHCEGSWETPKHSDKPKTTKKTRLKKKQ